MPTSVDKKRQSNITAVRGMRDYSKDPFVIEKLDRARAFIAKNGLPGDKKAKKSK